MPKKRPYYPNNWKAYKDSPDQFFLSMPYDQFMDWKLCGWEIPSSIGAVIRETNLKTGQVKEYSYQRESAARAKVKKIMAEGESEFLVCTQDEIHYLFPRGTNDDFDYEYEIQG
tara:strand:- start:104 stop:445 length:342 start_codon:yes stop_codon:yes gene_type:complete